MPSGRKAGPENSKDLNLQGSNADRIVLSALGLMRKQGYHKTGFDDIAEDICISPEDISACFASKEEICLRVLEIYNERLNEIFTRAEEQSNPRQRLSSLIDSLMDEDQTLLKYGCPITRFYLDLKNESPALEKAARGLINRRLDWIAEQFTLMSFIDEAADLATRLAGALYGVSLLASAAGDEGMLRSQLNQLKSWIRSM